LALFAFYKTLSFVIFLLKILFGFRRGLHQRVIIPLGCSSNSRILLTMLAMDQKS